MWLDNASSIDMLFYSPYADTVAKFTQNAELTPLTIGLYGSWGAGKSSLIQLIKQKIDQETDGIVCISLNAWQFEGYEDAKIAIMESLLKALQENRTFFEKAGEKIKKLLSRIEVLKLGKSIAVKGLPYLLSGLTGNPLPLAINLSTDLLKAKGADNVIDTLNNIKDNYLKPKEDSETQTDNVRKFRTEFEKMLAEVDSIKSLVVIVDDLDRCSPERIIETLEAIKLFLSVKKTTFIVAVDQRVIEYAVGVKYPTIDGYSISSDYIEKIIQLPIKIPELSSKDIENYLMLLIFQLHLEAESFKELVQTIHNNRMMIKDTPIDYASIEEILSKITVRYKPNTSITDLQNETSIISKISPAVSSSLKGNPRQAKRFLNTFFVRKSLAPLYFGEDIDLSIMAKLLALETIDIRAFRKLYEWSSEYNGEIKQLKEIESSIASDTELPAEYLEWNNPRLIRWVRSEPSELYKIDLNKYFYLSREALANTENVSTTFSEIERKTLSAIIHCIAGQEDARLKELKNLEPESQRKICDAILVHFRSDSSDFRTSFSIISMMYRDYPSFQTEIIEALKQKPKTFFTASCIPHFSLMRRTNPTQIHTLLNELERASKIKKDVIDLIEGNPVAKSIARS